MLEFIKGVILHYTIKLKIYFIIKNSICNKDK